MTTTQDAAEGAILGSLCGDAAGATLEFEKGTLPGERVAEALAMVGGGPWNTAPGQITDDGEMALSLMHALAGRDRFSVEAVAEQYYRWYTSPPFDLGGTTANGLCGAAGRRPGRLHEGMWEAAAERNQGSKANGALMRIVPLGVWGRRLEPSDLVVAACEDARLTHPHRTCQHASAVYCIAIRHLVMNPADASGAVNAARSWAEQLANDEVLEWLSLAIDGLNPGYSPHQGFVKYGFVHAFRHLVRGTSYESAVAETLAGGGDTDTNACIVGGLIGALHGAKSIPQRMQDAVYDCNVSRGQLRPAYLQTREVLLELVMSVA